MQPDAALWTRPAWRAGFSWQHVALVVWMAIVAVLGVRTLLRPLKHSVFPTFYNGARAWVRGENPYERQQGFDCHRYSPPATLLLVPFAVLPIGLGSVCWRLVNVGIFVSAIERWMGRAAPGNWSADDRAILLLLVLPLSIGSLNNGQSNPLLIGMLLLAVTAVCDQRWLLASAAIALAATIKIYPLALGLVFCLLWPRQMIGRLLLCLAALGILPFLFSSPSYVLEQYQHWFNILAADDRKSIMFERCYRDAWLLCRLWHVPIDGRTYLFAQLLSAAGVAGLALRCRLQGHATPIVLHVALSLTMCWTMLFGPATESCTYILLAPTLAWTLMTAWRAPTPGWVRVLLWASVALFVLAATASWFPFGAWLHGLGLQPLAALLLTVVVIARLPGRIPAYAHADRDESVCAALPRPA